jgi:hypothetical protein
VPSSFYKIYWLIVAGEFVDDWFYPSYVWLARSVLLWEFNKLMRYFIIFSLFLLIFLRNRKESSNFLFLLRFFICFFLNLSSSSNSLSSSNFYLNFSYSSIDSSSSYVASFVSSYWIGFSFNTSCSSCVF